MICFLSAWTWIVNIPSLYGRRGDNYFKTTKRNTLLNSGVFCTSFSVLNFSPAESWSSSVDFWYENDNCLDTSTLLLKLTRTSVLAESNRLGTICTSVSFSGVLAWLASTKVECFITSKQATFLKVSRWTCTVALKYLLLVRLVFIGDTCCIKPQTLVFSSSLIFLLADILIVWRENKQRLPILSEVRAIFCARSFVLH